MKEHAQELKAESRRGSQGNKADAEAAVLAKIAEMPEPDRPWVSGSTPSSRPTAPVLSPKPAGVRDAGVCQGRQGRLLLPERRQVQVEVRDTRLQRRRGTSTTARCGRPRSALKELTAAEEAKIGALVQRAVS